MEKETLDLKDWIIKLLVCSHKDSFLITFCSTDVISLDVEILQHLKSHNPAKNGKN